MTQVSRIPLSSEIEQRIFEIFLTSLSELRTKEEVEKFITDLLSPTERIMLSKRLSIAFLLQKGFDQRKIARILKVSLTTINRVSIAFKIGGNGYRRVIDKIIKGEKLDEFLYKIDDFIKEVVPPKGRNYRVWRTERFKDKKARQKPF